MRAQAAFVLELEAETRRSIRLTSRINLITRGVTGLLSILGLLSTLRTVQQMYTHGTIFPEAEAQADHVADYAEEMEQWAMDTTDQISLLGAVALISDADERNDAEALFDIDSAYAWDYYFACPPALLKTQRVSAFRDWFMDEIALFRTEYMQLERAHTIAA